MKLLFAACLLAAQPVSASSDYLSRPDVRSFIDSMSEEHGIDSSDLERILGNIRYTARGGPPDRAGAELGSVAGALVLTLSRRNS